MKLEDKILLTFDEFLASQLWQTAYGDFQKKGFKLTLKKIGSIPIAIDFGKFLKPEMSIAMIDRMLLEIKDQAYQYCKKNPEKAREFLRLAASKLGMILDEGLK